ncbi:Hypothetical protein SMAX5B_021243 [Scophthalmus maximus]|uniref:Uncharacterized protein n=1 Tax=Scophthalmus maximus TaxID=52904 RepID=A0A2U9BQY2_SCOMX|nr:Hypothetical protein SMAX5B_021243 [Scophthalmus maximus]
MATNSLNEEKIYHTIVCIEKLDVRFSQRREIKLGPAAVRLVRGERRARLSEIKTEQPLHREDTSEVHVRLCPGQSAGKMEGEAGGESIMQGQARPIYLPG